MSVKPVLAGTIAALAVGVVSVVGVTAASADAPTASGTVVAAPVSQGSDAEDPHAGTAMPFGGQLGELDDLMAAIPDELRADLEDATQAGDPGDVLRALAGVHDQAVAGEYGAEVREQVDELEAQLPSEAQLRQLMEQHLGALPIQVPAALQQALVEAAGNGDAGQRLTAVADVHDRALDGEYGAQAKTLVEQLGTMLEQLGTGGFPSPEGLGA